MHPRRVRGRRLRVSGLAALCLALSAAVAPAQAGDLSASIVNGTTTESFPSIGALLFYDDSERITLETLCSGTLIGCRTLLTAAHCVCPTLDRASCEGAGFIDAGTMSVFFQHAGFFDVVDIAVHPNFEFGVEGDVAVLELGGPVTGIRTSRLSASARLGLGTSATIIGFGQTGGGGRFGPGDLGIKRRANVTTTTCTSGIPDAAHICSEFDGTEGNICAGDSGGPLLNGAGVAGVTSGRLRGNCQPPDTAFYTDVFVHLPWILARLGTDAAPCAGLPLVNDPGATVHSQTSELSSQQPDALLIFDVPAGTGLLRVALNGQQRSDDRGDLIDNDFDLFVRRGQVPTSEAFDCSDRSLNPFGFCEIQTPQAGLWYARVTAVDGTGTAQITITSFASPAATATPTQTRSPSPTASPQRLTPIPTHTRTRTPTRTPTRTMTATSTPNRGPTQTPAPRPTPAGPGDANCDGEIDVMTEIAALATTVFDAHIEACPFADANGDGRVDAADYPALLRLLLDSP